MAERSRLRGGRALIGGRDGTSRRRQRRRGAQAVTLVVLAVLLAGCEGAEDEGTEGQEAASPPAETPAALTVEDRQVTVDGTGRTYRVQMPRADDPLPVVVVLHDAGNTIEGIVEVTQLHRAATQNGFAVVFPAAVEAAERTWNAEFCCGAGPSAGVDDIAFLDAVFDDLAADERLDADNVHLAGVSNGAVMAYRYACERAERVAAVGSVAGTMDADACEPDAPVSVLEIRGTADRVVPFDGGDMPDFVQATQPAMSADALADQWAEMNACSDAPAVTTEEPVTRTSWKSCDDGATVELIAIEGAGHTWYASEFGEVDGAVDATAEILRFFGLRGW